MISAAERSANDQNVATHVKKYGCHVYNVFASSSGEAPSFSYSIGIYESSGAPEAIVVGLTADLGEFVVNEYNRRVRAGTRFKRGTLYPGFLEGFSVYIEPAQAGLLREYTLGCERYYRDKGGYSVAQIVYPTIDGVWPWQRSASKWFKSNQPMLGRKRPDRP